MIGIFRALAYTGGEWVIYILIACSILAVAVIVERGILFSRERKQLDAVRGAFARFKGSAPKAELEQLAGELSRLSGLAARTVGAALARFVEGSAAVEEYSDSAASAERRRLEDRMIVLGTLGNNAIYIGLFGTVLGVIKAFKDLAQEASGPEVVMQGLSEALIATAVGLMVALPCVIAYNIFHKRINDLVEEAEDMVRLVVAESKARRP